MAEVRDPRYPVSEPKAPRRQAGVTGRPEGKIRRVEQQMTLRQPRGKVLRQGYAGQPLVPHRENVSFRMGVGKAAQRVKER
jgi:hypothetical protein